MISRPRLLDDLAGPNALAWLVEAGAGYGKTVLLDQLRQRLLESLIVVRRPVGEADLQSFINELGAAARRSGHPSTAEAVAGAESDPAATARALIESNHSLAIDDIDQWGETVAAFVVDVVSESKDQLRVVVAGRQLPKPLAGQSDPTQWNHLDADALAFTPEETEDLLVATGVDIDAAVVLQDVSSGWPLAVSTSAARMANASDPLQIARELGRQDHLVEGLLQPYLNDLDEVDLATAVHLARLPFFDAAIAEILGTDGVIARLAAVGIPVTHRLDGWAEIAGQFRAALARQPHPTAIPSAVTEYLVSRGEIQAAITICVAAGEMEAAARLIASLSLQQQTLVEPTALNAAITTLAKAAESAPRCLLVQAEVNGSFGRMPEGMAALERAIEIFNRTDPGMEEPDHVEVALVFALWQGLSAEFDEARSRLAQCESVLARHASARLEARAHDVRAVLLQMEGTPDALETATQEYTKALAKWRSLGEGRPAAVTSFRLAAGLLADSGRRTEALELLDSLPSVGTMTLVNRARLALERSLLLPYLGRAREVRGVAGEARRIGSMLGHEWLVAWTYWSEIVAASIINDGEEVDRLVDEFEATGYIVMDDGTQAGMWCEVSDALGRCGRIERAEEVLTRARALAPDLGWFAEYPACTLLARAGDPVVALERLETLSLDTEVDPDRRWRIDLFRSYCHWRLGQHDESAKWFASAVERADDLGQSSLPDIVEGRIVAEMQSDHPDPVAPFGPIVEVSLFEEFRVRVNGALVAVPRGHSSTIVKLLVLNDGRAMVDQVIDPLWPDANLEQGRKRLRNVVNRVRDACGPIIERQGDQLLLVGVASDFGRAGELASEALGEAASAETVYTAIRANENELLPGDRYEPWAEDARNQQRVRLVALLDAQASLAEASGDLEMTVAALRRAHELDDLRSNRLATAAALLRDAGRDAAAAALGADR